MSREAFGIWDSISRKVFRATYSVPKDEVFRTKLLNSIKDRELAAYIHIPFCTGTCWFCPYVRYVVSRSELERVLSKYFRGLIKEVRMYGELLKDLNLRITDVHVGGGTPSLVPGKYWRELLEELRSNFNLSSGLAIEAYPEDLSDESLANDLVDSGVEEVSLGVQSLNPKVLKVLGRRHSVNDSLRAIDNLRRAGIKYLNIDLMYMTPGQSIEDWVEDLEDATGLDVDEITCYPTLVVEWSLGYRLMREGKIPQQPDMGVFKKMVYACEDILPSKGYLGLEIYGYSRVKDWKYVTVNYEMEGPLISFGVGSMGFTGSYEYQNTCSINEYLRKLGRDEFPVLMAREVSIEERAIRYSTCKLFVCRCLRRSRFKEVFRRDFDELVGKTGFKWFLKLLKVKGDVVDDGESIRLTRKGLFTAHKICWAFVLNVPCNMAKICMNGLGGESVTIP